MGTFFVATKMSFYRFLLHYHVTKSDCTIVMTLYIMNTLQL